MCKVCDRKSCALADKTEVGLERNCCGRKNREGGGEKEIKFRSGRVGKYMGRQAGRHTGRSVAWRGLPIVTNEAGARRWWV